MSLRFQQRRRPNFVREDRNGLVCPGNGNNMLFPSGTMFNRTVCYLRESSSKNTKKGMLLRQCPMPNSQQHFKNTMKTYEL